MNTFTLNVIILFVFFAVETVNNCFAASTTTENYFDLSLEELSNLPVISGISRKKQKSFHSASASYVITQEDIRRSGMTSLPDLLRMVPGMHIGQQNGNIWSINTRSPNTQFSDELLVMIDGRSVYNTLFNGVSWSRIDTMLEDIERVEVIRGPGSSLWGSNASNGIVNIVTKKASDTQGLLINASGGTKQFNNEFSARYGFAGETHDSRLYMKQTRLIPSTYPPAHGAQMENDFPSGNTAYDGRKFLQTGFRSELFLSSTQLLTLQGDFYNGKEEEMRIPAQKNIIDVTGHNLLTRYHHTLHNESSVVLQVYFNYVESEDDIFTDTSETYDIDLYHNFSFSQQKIIWGAGFREINNRTDHTVHSGGFALSPANRTTQTTTFFIQDELTLIEDSLSLIMGSKFEKNDYTDYESQPNIKLAYQYNDKTFFWGSLAKAVSIPSRTVADGYLDFNDLNRFCSFLPADFTNDPELGCIIDISSSKLQAGILYAKELGYRQQLNNKVSIDNTVFYQDYRHQDGLAQDTDYLWGYEGIVNVQISNTWKLEASWTYHRGKNSKTDNESHLVPRNSGFLSSYYDINEQMDFDVSYYYSGHTDTQDRYHRVDLRLGYRPTNTIELSLVGTNLFDPKHSEGNINSKRADTNIERAIVAKISYKFK